MASPLAPRIQEHELALLVLEYLEDNSTKFPNALKYFQQESGDLLRNVIRVKKVKSLENIMNEYFKLLHFDATNRAFVLQHSTLLQRRLRGTLENLTKFLGYYKTVREVRDSLHLQLSGSTTSSYPLQSGIETGSQPHSETHTSFNSDSRADTMRHHSSALRAARGALQNASTNVDESTTALTSNNSNVASLNQSGNHGSSRKRKSRAPQQWRGSPKKAKHSESSFTKSRNNLLNTPIDHINKNDFLQSMINQAPAVARIINSQVIQQLQDQQHQNGNGNKTTLKDITLTDTDAHELIEMFNGDSSQDPNIVESSSADAILSNPGIAEVIRASCNNASLHKHASTETMDNDTSEVLESMENIQAKPGPVISNPFEFDDAVVAEEVSNTSVES